MRELFLTAVVKDSDFTMSCAVMQGFAWMTARKSYHRILFYDCDPQPKPLKNVRAFQQSRHPQLWRDLSNQLSRTAYILQIAYEVNLDKDLGKGTTMDFNSLPGTLRWMDLPDPAKAMPVISRKKEAEGPEQLATIRKKIEIPDQTMLPTALTDNGFRYKSEVIQESYTYVRDNMEFVYTKYWALPDSPGQPVTTMPSFADLRPADPRPFWIFNVKLNVFDDSQPDKVKKANDELLDVKAELDGIFRFRAVERRFLDSRVATNPVRA